MLKNKKFQKTIDIFYFLITLTILAVSVYFFYDYVKKLNKEKEIKNLKLEITLPFESFLSNKYTCDGKNINFWIKINNYKKIKEIAEKYDVNFSLIIEINQNKKVIWKEKIPLVPYIEEGKLKDYPGICPPLFLNASYELKVYLIKENGKQEIIDIYSKNFFYRRIDFFKPLENI